MSNNNKTPAIRFKGFTDTWEQRKLGDMCDEFQSGKSIKASDITDSGEYAVYGGNGFRGYTDTYNHDGDYALIGRQGALCGNMNFSSGKAYFTEHAVAVHGNADNDTLFLYYLLDLMNLGQYSGQSAQPGLAVNKIIQLKTKAPKLDEQRLISSFFKQLDSLITLHQRKCDKLIQFKAAMLKKMFPQNGADKPEIRFRGFTDAWEQRKLGDIASDMVAGGDIDKDLILAEGQYPVIANALTGDGIVGYYDKEYRVNAPVVTVTGRGDVGHAKARLVNFTPVVRLLSVKSEHDVFFLENAINTLKIVIESTGVPQLTVPQLAKYEVAFPRQLDEEEHIGAFFKQLDTLITLHQRKCDKYKSIKSGLIRKLFP